MGRPHRSQLTLLTALFTTLFQCLSSTIPKVDNAPWGKDQVLIPILWAPSMGFVKKVYAFEWISKPFLSQTTCIAFNNQGALERIYEIWVTKIDVIRVYLWWADSDMAPLDPQLLLCTLLCHHLPLHSPHHLPSAGNDLLWMKRIRPRDEVTPHGQAIKDGDLPPCLLWVTTLVQRATWPGSEAMLVQQSAWNWSPQAHSPRGTESRQQPQSQLGTRSCSRWTRWWLWSLTAAWWVVLEQRPQLNPALLPDSRTHDKIIKYCVKPLIGEGFV